MVNCHCIGYMGPRETPQTSVYKSDDQREDNSAREKTGSEMKLNMMLESTIKSMPNISLFSYRGA